MAVLKNDSSLLENEGTEVLPAFNHVLGLGLRG